MYQVEPPEVQIEHNFDAINKYVDHVLDRQRELLAFRRFKRIKMLLVGVALILISSGVAYVLFSWGEYIQKQKPSPTVELLNRDTLAQASELSQQTGSRVTVDYTIFQTVHLAEGVEVVSGYKFLPDQPDFPFEQYCYQATGGATQSTIKSLAEKKGKGQVDWSKSIDQGLFAQAEKNCLFRY